jgi:hypothetical protein
MGSAPPSMKTSSHPVPFRPGQFQARALARTTSEVDGTGAEVGVQEYVPDPVYAGQKQNKNNADEKNRNEISSLPKQG